MRPREPPSRAAARGPRARREPRLAHAGLTTEGDERLSPRWAVRSASSRAKSWSSRPIRVGQRTRSDMERFSHAAGQRSAVALRVVQVSPSGTRSTRATTMQLEGRHRSETRVATTSRFRKASRFLAVFQDVDDVACRDDNDWVIVVAQFLICLRSEVARRHEDAELSVSEP